MVNMKFDCLLLHDYLGVDIFMVQTNSWCRYIQDYLGADIFCLYLFYIFLRYGKTTAMYRMVTPSMITHCLCTIRNFLELFPPLYVHSRSPILKNVRLKLNWETLT